MEFIFLLDQTVFSAIYNLPHPPVLITIFSFLSGIGTWGLVWVCIMVALIAIDEVNNKWDLATVVVSLVTTILAVDVVIKDIFKRARPNIGIMEPAVFFGWISTYSFPSSHAAFAFAGAYVLSRKHKKGKILYYLLASLIAFSRIYLGRHYPIDVVGGGVAGILIGFLSVKLMDRWLVGSRKKK